MLQRGLIPSHWSIIVQGVLDFHEFTEGMATAAVRIVLRAIVARKKEVEQNRNSIADAPYVHPIANDLHIITGHALHRAERDGSVLQPSIIEMLKQEGVHCQVNPDNKGRLIVTSSALSQYAKRASR
jgi:hypothetical protein